MNDLRATLAKAIDEALPQDGLYASPIPGVHLGRWSVANRESKTTWRASLSLLVQGGKALDLGDHTHRFEEAHYIAAPIEVPVANRLLNVTADRPFLGLLIELDPLVLTELAGQVDEPAPARARSSRALFGGPISTPMFTAALRLLELMRTPADARVLAPLVTKELIYHVLAGPGGADLRQFVRADSRTHRISRAALALRANLRRELDVDALAKAAGMGRSLFFKHFKEVMAMSPVQFQKRLRLLEARRLLQERGETAEAAAYQVGYNSASQFSREYARMFGRPPARDAERANLSSKRIRL